MSTRTELESQESKLLAPYAMKSAESLGRRYPEPEHDYRTAFQRDRDRVIHSTAFRRLEYKTQVFVNHEGDHYRTRLTHTIEVTQIARTIARALNLNEDLTEAIALAHDLGHTPFGHAGEEALHELMKGYGGFEHNAQGLRVVELLERRYPQYTGLNLSYEVRESLVKHKTAYDKPQIPAEYHPEWQPLLEAQVVDAADVIAYDNHDLDDGIRGNLTKDADLKDVQLWQTASSKHRDTPPEFFRPQTIITLINIMATDLVNNSIRLLKESNIKNVADARRSGRLIAFSEQVAAQRKELEDFLYKNVYRHYRVVRMAEKSKRFIELLFNAYIDKPAGLPIYYQKLSQQEGVGLHQAVADYLSGMTDRYAQEEYKKLFEPFEKT
ncbi:MAG: deoxyguanosinetriphosphate triphosphohydrolase [Planctomycetes bacterium]|nr:deoxyguanosinetriphosphate triphosphohydrolase [Planctomycetota bacterium]